MYSTQLKLKPLTHVQGVQQVTAEKVSPSPIDFVALMQQAVAIEQRLERAGVSKALKDTLTRCVGEYNRMVTKRSHRIDTQLKCLILNLFLGSIIIVTSFLLEHMFEPGL